MSEKVLLKIPAANPDIDYPPDNSENSAQPESGMTNFDSCDTALKRGDDYPPVNPEKSARRECDSDVSPRSGNGLSEVDLRDSLDSDNSHASSPETACKPGRGAPEGNLRDSLDLDNSHASLPETACKPGRGAPEGDLRDPLDLDNSHAPSPETACESGRGAPEGDLQDSLDFEDSHASSPEAACEPERGVSKKALRRAARGDREAFAEVFSQVEQEIYRVAFIYVKNRDDALDIVQETALRCFVSSEKLRNYEHFRTWAVRTAINCSIDFLRKSKREISFEGDYIPPSDENAEREILSKITLEGLLDVLDNSEKTVILLKYHCGYTFAEISRLLGIPLGTAKSVCYRALKKLREEVCNYE